MVAQLDVGSWGLFSGFDCRQLVRIDDEPCGPVSARKLVRAVPRRLLLDENRVREAYRTGAASQEIVEHGAALYQVILRPILAPRTHVPMAVLAIVADAAATVPAPPLVGGWEWEIAWDGTGSPSPQTRSRAYWDRNLFRVYEVDPAVAQQHLGYWEAGDWTNDLLAPADQMRVNVSIRDGIIEGLNGAAGVLRCLTYNVITGYGSDEPGSKHLRLVGFVAPSEPDDEVVMMRGLSYEVPADYHDIAFEGDAGGARVDDVLRGVLEMSREPMAVVDAFTLDVLVASRTWHNSVAKELGDVGKLTGFTSEEAEILQGFILRAAESAPEHHSMVFELRRSDGVVQPVGMTVTGVSSGSTGLYAVIRIDQENFQRQDALRPAP